MKLYITFSPKKVLLAKNLLINSVFLQKNWWGKHGLITKFLKKSLKNAGKKFSPHFVVWFKTRSQFSSACKNQRKSLLIQSRIEFPYPILMTLDRGKISGKITVKLLITNTSEEFIKCHLDNFSISFILYYVNFSICENK